MSPAPSPGGTVELRLYVSMGAPNSMLAIANLEAIRQQRVGDGSSISVEIVDVFREPGRAMDDAVLLTPMLVKVSPGEKKRILGVLADTQAVLAVLGLPGASE